MKPLTSQNMTEKRCSEIPSQTTTYVLVLEDQESKSFSYSYVEVAMPNPASQISPCIDFLRTVYAGFTNLPWKSLESDPAVQPLKYYDKWPTLMYHHNKKDGLFIGQSQGFLDFLNELAAEADAAVRGSD